MSAAQVPAWLRPLQAALPGVAAERLGRIPPPAGGRRDSAVLVLFGEGPAGPDVLLTQRADLLRSHAGQPAFPGGATEPADADPVATALREAHEEVGVHAAGVQVLGTLPQLYLPPSGYVVVPVVAWWHTPSPLVPEPGEIATAARVPVAQLVDPANRHAWRHPAGHAGPAFVVAGMYVWGFTAMLLDGLLDLGGWTRPWATDDVRDLPPAVLAGLTEGRVAAANGAADEMATVGAGDAGPPGAGPTARSSAAGGPA